MLWAHECDRADNTWAHVSDVLKKSEFQYTRWISMDLYSPPCSLSERDKAVPHRVEELGSHVLESLQQETASVRGTTTLVGLYNLSRLFARDVWTRVLYRSAAYSALLNCGWCGVQKKLRRPRQTNNNEHSNR